jgi:D-alanyl-D-alanine carboxypeptidase
VFITAVNTKEAILLYDVTDRKFLIKHHIYEKRHPASLTKEMTLYLVFKALKEKKITFNTKFRVSKWAAMQAPCKISLICGEYTTIRLLIESMIVHSANDSAVCIAEGLCKGNLKNFVRLMNRTAKKLGMHHTHFTNPTGLPDKTQFTTAFDLLKISHALQRDFPEYFHFFRKTKFTYKKRTYYTRYRLIRKPGVYGIKTGYIAMSGFNVATSAIRFDKRGRPHLLIAIVMGQPSSFERDRKTWQLLNHFYKGGKKC